MIDMKPLILKGNVVKSLSCIDVQMFYKDEERLSKEKCNLLVCFCREALQDIRFLPRNPFTEWLEIDRQKTDFRITVLNVTIDDIDLIDDPFFTHIESMIERFERTYAHLKLEFPCYFRDYHEDLY